MTPVNLGFLAKPLMLPVSHLLPSVNLDRRLLASQKFRQIQASIAEIGLIEPLAVTAVERKSGQHMVLDGHLRLEAMKALGHSEIACIVATDDETFTYNHHISRLSTIQEHLMIRRAIDRGISPAKLAKGLSIDISLLQRKKKLLDGICPEVIEILQDRNFSPDIPAVLRKMKPSRQIECAQLMVAANRVTVRYAESLLAATPVTLLVDGKKAIRGARLNQDQVARMENEMSSLIAQYRMAEQSHGEDVLNLMLARGYVIKLMDHPNVMKYMQGHFPDLLDELAKVVAMTSLDA